MDYKVRMVKRAIKAVLIFAMAGALNVPAAFAAEDWLTLPASAPDITFTIDKASIERHGNIVKFWEKITFDKPKVKDEASGVMIKEKKVHRIMDCADHSQGVISGATLGENGRFITAVEFSEDQISMSAIPPGTLAAEELDLVCVSLSKQ
jgi:hypothetical protein